MSSYYLIHVLTVYRHGIPDVVIPPLLLSPLTYDIANPYIFVYLVSRESSFTKEITLLYHYYHYYTIL